MSIADSRNIAIISRIVRIFIWGIILSSLDHVIEFFSTDWFTNEFILGVIWDVVP